MTTVSDLFDIRYGQSLELNRLKRTTSALGVAFVSRQMGDNGVSAFVEQIRDVAPALPGEMSVALGGNGVLSTFLQERPFYTGRDVAILSSKKPMSKATLLYYAMCIKANRYRYSYGRQANRSLPTIVVPSPANLPTWVLKTEVDRFGASKEPKIQELVALPPHTKWRRYRLGDLFDLKKGKRLTKSDMVPGTTPFIGAVDNNNGLTAFVGQPAIHTGNTITVNYNGNGVAEAYYQPIAYRCSVLS